MRLDARSCGQREQRITDERVLRKTVDLEAGPRGERDPVGEIDPLEHRRHLVLAVRPERADDEREVDLRRRPCAAHRSASARATNSRGSSASARMSAGRPIVSSACAARAPRDEARELEGVRERLAAVRKGGFDDPLDLGVRLGQPRPAEGDERRVDVRLRPEDRAGDRMEAGALGDELDEHRDGAVRLRRWARRRTGRRPPAAPSPSSGRRSAARRGSRRLAVSRCCTEGWRRASPGRLERSEVEAKRVAEVDVDVRWPASRSARCGSSARSSSTAWTRATRSAR